MREKKGNKRGKEREKVKEKKGDIEVEGDAESGRKGR